jgi:6-phosphogluconolactonase
LNNFTDIFKNEIFNVIAQKEYCNLCLTGGRSAKALYSVWKNDIELQNSLLSCNIYFTDERCVPPDHDDSNFKLVKRTLFDEKLTLINVFRIRAEKVDVAAEAVRYETILPENMDVMLLSMGEDGHIASLFPHSNILKENKRFVVPVIGPKPPNKRITVTPVVITRAKQVFTLAIGAEKQKMYEQALKDPQDIETIPARLVLNRQWIFDLD